MLIGLKLTLVDTSITRGTLGSAADAASGHFDWMSLGELGVEETVLNSQTGISDSRGAFIFSQELPSVVL